MKEGEGEEENSKGKGSNPIDISDDSVAFSPQASKGIPLDDAVELCCSAGRLPKSLATEAIYTRITLGLWTIAYNDIMRAPA